MKNTIWRVVGVIIVLASAAGLVAAKILFISQWEIEDTTSLILSLITECVSILITVFIIDAILKREERLRQVRLEQEKQDEYKRIIGNVLGNRLKDLFREISTTYLNFVLKEPAHLSPELNFKDYKDRIEEVLQDIDSLVVAGFRSKPVKFFLVNTKQLSIPEEQILDYQRYCEVLFKQKIQGVIDEFIQRYVSILPDDLRIQIYIIENSIADFIFVTPLQLGHNAPMPTRPDDIIELKRELTKIGESLIGIYEIIEAAS